MTGERREDTDAFKRIYCEEVTGAVIECRDGTRIEGGVVVAVGSRAIVDEAGKLIGFTPEPDAGSQERF